MKTALSAPRPFALPSFAPLCFALLCFAYVPQALAFPPCPKAPLALIPVESEGEGTLSAGNDDLPIPGPWYVVRYTMVGDLSLIESNAAESSENPNTGKCGDRGAVPIPVANASSGTIGLTPGYAPISAFSAIALPDWTASAPWHGTVSYAFEFAIDNASLPTGAWIDLLQFELRSDGSGQAVGGQSQTSAVYRLRKLSTAKFPSALVLIESLFNDSDKPTNDRIVALLPLQDPSGATPMRLRWSQSRRIVAPTHIDTSLEWTHADGRPLYEAKLDNQWADLLLMGLLDYNTGQPPLGAPLPRVQFSKMELSAE
ncbi:MAG: hypothetical protein IT473_04135 [Lysobacter sp.]|nr:hypothetical protein [Lysobacter sp.]